MCAYLDRSYCILIVRVFFNLRMVVMTFMVYLWCSAATSTVAVANSVVAFELRCHIVSSPLTSVAAMPRRRRRLPQPCRIVAVDLRRLVSSSSSLHWYVMYSCASVVVDGNFTHVKKGETKQCLQPTKQSEDVSPSDATFFMQPTERHA